MTGSAEAFFINLDRQTARAEYMAAMLERAGLRAERFPAVDGATMGMSPRYRPASWGAYWELTRTEVAVFESHRAIWGQIVERGLEAAVILEDDVLAAGGFGPAARALLQAGDAFDLVKLDGVGGIARFGPAREVAGQTLRPIAQTVPSAAAYVLSRRGAEDLLKRSARYSDHLDDFILRPRTGWRAYQLFPAQAVQGMFTAVRPGGHVPPGIMGSERTGGVAPDVNRGPVPYRLWKELRRSGRKLARAWGGDARLTARGGIVGEVPLAPEIGPYR